MCRQKDVLIVELSCVFSSFPFLTTQRNSLQSIFPATRIIMVTWVDMERGPLSIVKTIEELLGKKVAAPV
jgi:hypothetical protein